jgi:hypothetical protein
MSNRARQRRLYLLNITPWWEARRRNYERRRRHAIRPGHGMGMGANTLIHNGGKP